MAQRYLISQDSPVLYITLVTKDRLPVFRKDELKQVLCRAVDEARKKFLLFAYVIMLDHAHLLASRSPSTSEVLRVLKGLTARRVIDHLKENDYYSRCQSFNIRSASATINIHSGKPKRMYFRSSVKEMFMQKVNYLHHNPVRAGLVERATDYRWSSARIWQGCPSEHEPLLMDKDLIYWRQRLR